MATNNNKIAHSNGVEIEKKKHKEKRKEHLLSYAVIHKVCECVCVCDKAFVTNCNGGSKIC